MTFSFLQRKINQMLGVTISIAIFAFSLFAYQIQHALLLSPNLYVGYIVSTDTGSTTSCATKAYLQGGAGYIARIKTEEYAVYACYQSIGEMEEAKARLQAKKIPVASIDVSPKDLYLKTRKQKGMRTEIHSTLLNLEGNVQLLHTLTRETENGNFTQSRIKEILETLLASMQRLLSSYFLKDSSPMQEGISKTLQIKEEIVLAKDLRYVEALVCESYLNFCEEFSL